MQVIEFRGKQENDQWVYGLVSKNKNGQFEIINKEDDIAVQVKPSTIGQYVDIKDSVNTKTFVGDVYIDNKSRMWVIYNSPGGFSSCRVEEYYSALKQCLSSSLADVQNVTFFKESCRIIGNVIDNEYLVRQDMDPSWFFNKRATS